MRKVVHKNSPEYLVELLPNTVGAITSYNLRNKDDFDQFDLHSKSLGNHCYLIVLGNGTA